MTIGYVEASGQLAGQQGCARREFLEDLLAGRLLTATEVSERATTLGLRLPTRPSLLVAAPRAGDGSLLAERARTAVRVLARRSHETPRLQLLTRGQLVLIVDHDADLDTIRRGLADAELRGVVISATDPLELPGAYRRARRIHDLIGEAMIPADRTIDHDEALMLDTIVRLREDPLAHEAAAAILGGLTTTAGATLLETLDAYFATGNAVSAAHRLGIHAQTMRHRLGRIRAITGRGPAQGWDRFLLEFALRLSAPGRKAGP